MMNRRVLLALSGLGVLSGCGFQLRDREDSMDQLPKTLRIEATDPYSLIVQKITRELTHQGVQIVSANSAPTLMLTPPKVSERILGPISDSEDQTELALEMSYSLLGQNLVSLVTDTKVRVTLIYISNSTATSAEHQRVAQLRGSLEEDLALKVASSIRISYRQAVKQTKRSKTN